MAAICTSFAIRSLIRRPARCRVLHGLQALRANVLRSQSQSFASGEQNGSGNDSDEQDITATSRSKVNLSRPPRKLRDKLKDAQSTSKHTDELPLQEKVEGVAPELVNAASEVAQELGGDTDRTVTDLLGQLQRHAELTGAHKRAETTKSVDVGNLLSSMRVSTTARRGRVQQKDPSLHRGSLADQEAGRNNNQAASADSIIGQMRNAGSGRTWHRARQPFNERRGPEAPTPRLFSGPRLGIFNKEDMAKTPKDTRKPTLFDKLEEQEKATAYGLPPQNAWQEAIELTKQGKLWIFPIDNDQGLDEEAKVSFAEHVFLEEYLTGFPASGAVRQFMELVCNGLSLNPYLSVAQKKEHIAWFSKYFKDKTQILDDFEKLVAEQKQQAQLALNSPETGA